MLITIVYEGTWFITFIIRGCIKTFYLVKTFIVFIKNFIRISIDHTNKQSSPGDLARCISSHNCILLRMIFHRPHVA